METFALLSLIVIFASIIVAMSIELHWHIKEVDRLNEKADYLAFNAKAIDDDYQIIVNDLNRLIKLRTDQVQSLVDEAVELEDELWTVKQQLHSLQS